MEATVTLETPEAEPIPTPAPVVIPAPAPETGTLDLAQEVGRVGAIVEQLQTDLSEVREIAESAKYIAENPITRIAELEPEPEPITEIPVTTEPESAVEVVQAAPSKPRGLLDWIL